MIVEGQDLKEVVHQDEGLGLLLGILDGVVDELEDDGLEVEVVDGGGLDLTSELDVVLLVSILEDKFSQVSFGRDILSLDLLIHFLETNDDKLQNLLLFLIFRVLLGNLKVVFQFELIDHFLHVLGEQEGEQDLDLEVAMETRAILKLDGKKVLPNKLKNWKKEILA